VEKDVYTLSCLTGYTVCGRVDAKRAAGSNLLFVDLIEQPGGHKLQVVVQKNNIAVPGTTATRNEVKGFAKLIERGDTIGKLTIIYSVVPLN